MRSCGDVIAPPKGLDCRAAQSASRPTVPIDPSERGTPMKIHEYQAKELLRAHGVPVPRGYPPSPCAKPRRPRRSSAGGLGGQGPDPRRWPRQGRRREAGAHARRSADLAGQILGMQLKTHQTGPEGQKVRRLLIEEGADIKKEYYVAALTDRATQKVAMMASSEGGMDIEEVAHSTPEKILKVFVDPLTGLTDAQALELADGIGVPPPARRRPWMC
jgi:succinyl-CoA synthetase beta subunit